MQHQFARVLSLCIKVFVCGKQLLKSFWVLEVHNLIIDGPVVLGDHEMRDILQTEP